MQQAPRILPYSTITPGYTLLFDLIVFPLSLEAGRETYENPGLYVATPPRKTARMRAQDILILYWKPTITGTVVPPLTPAQQQEILRKLAETYYVTAGSVTSGMSAAVDRLNEFLLARNLRTSQGGQVTAVLTLGVLRRDTLVIAHAGAAHTFHLTKSAGQHFHDQQASRGLGLARQAQARFHQTTLEAGDFLLLCADPSPALTRSLTSGPQGSLEHIRRRMLSEAGSGLQAVVIRLQPGSGKVSYWKPSVQDTSSPERRSPAETQPPQTAKVDGPAAIQPGIPAPESAQDLSFSVPEEATAVDSAAVAFPANLDTPAQQQAEPRPALDAPEAVVLAGPVQPLHPRSSLRPQTGETTGQTAAQRRIARQSQTAGVSAPAAQPLEEAVPAGPPFGETLRRRLAALWRGGRAARARVGGAVSRVTGSVLPRPVEPVSRGWWLAIPILVPLIVVAIASAVYFQTGRNEQYQVLFLQTQQAVQQASQLTDNAQQREAWNRVLEMVAATERYGKTDETAAIRDQAQATLDELEGLTRLEFQPAVSSELGPNVVVSRIVAKLNQAYMLDATEGRILSMARVTSGGYELNAFFTCGPGQAGGAIIGPLIDLAELPVNNALNAEIMGIDAGGNLVYCGSGKTTFDSRPLTLPDTGWGQITGITTYGEMLYVLDNTANMVYWYAGDKGIYADAPRLYFDLDIPNLTDVIDLAVDQEFLYLLHATGEMTVCTASGTSYANTRCNDPMPYGDLRAGYEPSPLSFAGARFTQLQTTLPPDPSLFILDTANQSVYHLSLRRLNLQRQYLSQTSANFPFPNRAPSAFAVTPNRRLLVAFDNQLFFAPLP